MSEYTDSIIDDSDYNFTGDDTIVPFDDDRNYENFRQNQDQAFGGLYGC